MKKSPNPVVNRILPHILQYLQVRGWPKYIGKSFIEYHLYEVGVITYPVFKENKQSERERTMTRAAITEIMIKQGYRKNSHGNARVYTRNWDIDRTMTGAAAPSESR